MGFLNGVVQTTDIRYVDGSEVEDIIRPIATSEVAKIVGNVAMETDLDALETSVNNSITSVNTKMNTVETKLDAKCPFSFGVDSNGNYGYKKAGADTVYPFKNYSDIITALNSKGASLNDDADMSDIVDAINNLNITLSIRVRANEEPTGYCGECYVSRNGSVIKTIVTSTGSGDQEKTDTLTITI